MSDKFFDCLNAINYKNKEFVYERKMCSAWMLLLWFSHSSNVCSITNDINHLIGQLPDELFYKYLFNKVPKGKRFLKWTKGDKSFDEKAMKELKEELVEHDLSKRELMSILMR